MRTQVPQWHTVTFDTVTLHEDTGSWRSNIAKRRFISSRKATEDIAVAATPSQIEITTLVAAAASSDIAEDVGAVASELAASAPSTAPQEQKHQQQKHQEQSHG